MLKFKAFFVLFCTFLMVNPALDAQVYDPVDWSFSVKEISDTEAELIFTAVIEEGWHIYATELSSDEGPLPTEFLFNKSSDYKKLGKVQQGKFKTEYDPNFQMDLDYFEEKAVFKQKIKRLSNKNFKVSGELSFMVCDADKCLPPEYIEYNFDVKGAVESPKSESPAFGSSSVSMGSLGEEEPDELESQIFDPVDWRFFVEEETDTTAVLVAEATLEPKWHIYSMYLESDMGPVPTSLTFEASNGFELAGKAMEGEPVIMYDPNFDMDLGFFSDKAQFKQKIRKLTDEPVKITGYITFMVCDDEKCLPPDDIDFSFAIEAGAANVEASKADVETTGSKKESSRSNWAIFIIAFFSGFAALLTPCVFPMIPMTVSFFTKQSKTRSAGIKNAIIFGLSIIGIYVLLGAIITWAFESASIWSEMSTNPWFNIFFFLLLIVFAISFLGAFEITLPSSWINKADSKADKGGLIGIFFMAFVLALVSFSCTGPIVGSLLVEAATRGGAAPVIGMLGFSLAIALPFALFAAFPGWLNSLPQSGGWLNSVKVVLGFLELALAFKFLSNADLVMDYHLLEREVFLAIWIVIFGLLTLYLLGKLKLPHDSDLKFVSVPRLLMAIVTGVFTIYMIPGLWGAPLKLISAFPPPMQYSESPMGVGFSGGAAAVNAPEDDDQHLGPQNIYVFHDYDKGLAFAKEKNLPLMLDFTGKACVNCRKMEEQVWSDPEIKRKLSEEMVLVSLYVDFREPLPKSEQITVDLGNGREKKLRTVGDKWAAMQEIKYKINAQPYYVLLDHNEEMLVEPANYQDYGEVDLFSDWLDRGIEKFKK